ncbi:MAG: class I SAM-dependent methyltransferase [Pyrinomonadaceae bacterium]|nr:class I SAM-dependent methyltransferase [Pyrinomonadaceae bacterium]
MLYDGFAASYDRLLAPAEKYFLRRLRERAVSFLPADGSILEIGAGTGANFEFFPSSAACSASEISAEMLKIARGKISEKNISLVQTDVQNLPFCSNAFDAAISTLVFCALAQPECGFAEIIRTVKPGGKVVLLEHVRPPGTLGYIFDALNWFTVRLIEDCFNRETAAMAEKCGLTIVMVEKAAFGIINLIVCKNEKSN